MSGVGQFFRFYSFTEHIPMPFFSLNYGEGCVFIHEFLGKIYLDLGIYLYGLGSGLPHKLLKSSLFFLCLQYNWPPCC